VTRHAVNRAATLALIRQLRAVAPAQRPRRRVGRIPKPQQPRLIENAYHATLRRLVCDVARDCFDREAPEILHALEMHRAARGHTDSQPDTTPVVVRGWSHRDKAATRAALVLAWNDHGQLLLGRRRSGGAWTLPGGHLLPGESPLRGAGRELEEETNLTCPDLALADAWANPDGVQLWLYTGTVRGAPTGYFDPDQECSAWRFVDVSAGLPADVAANLSGPPAPHNVLLQLFPPSGTHADARRRPPTAPPPPRGGPGVGAAQAKAEAERLRKLAAKLSAQLAAASEQGKRAALAIERAARAFADVFAPDELHAVVLQFGKRTEAHAREQLDQQLRSAIGVPLSAIERKYRDPLDGWAAENIDLIETVPDRYFDRLRLDVLDAFEGGTHPNTLADEFTDRYGMSDRDAERIARDQVLSLQADMLQARLVDLGVEEYIWRTVGDGRVRDNHAALDGTRCRFDQPPDGGGTDEGEDGNPGDGILCRCYPEPIFDVLQEPDSAGG